MNLNFLDRFFEKMLRYRIYRKSFECEPNCSVRTDRRRGKRDETNSSFWQFGKMRQKLKNSSLLQIPLKWLNCNIDLHRRELSVCQYTDVSQVLTVSIFSVEQSKTTYVKSVWFYWQNSEDCTNKRKIYLTENGKI